MKEKRGRHDSIKDNEIFVYRIFVTYSNIRVFTYAAIPPCEVNVGKLGSEITLKPFTVGSTLPLQCVSVIKMISYCDMKDLSITAHFPFMFQNNVASKT